MPADDTLMYAMTQIARTVPWRSGRAGSLTDVSRLSKRWRTSRTEAGHAAQALFNTKRWRDRRDQHRKKHPVCERCKAIGKIEPTAAINHKIPHHGRADIFWSSPLEALCSWHHNSEVQSEEKRGYSRAVDENGMPLDPAHPANRT